MMVGWTWQSPLQWFSRWTRRRPFAGTPRRKRHVYPAERTARTPAAASVAFSPTRAQNASARVVGRQAEVEQIVSALLDAHAHVVLFSERGRGKTSLTNLAVESLRQRGAILARYTCEAHDDYDNIIRGLARDIPAALLPKRARPPKGEGCEAILPARKLSAGDVAAIGARFGGRTLIFIVDEFDRTTDLPTRTRMADTMKLLADKGIDLHFVLVAVSVTLEEILGQHPSVQRNLFALHLPLLAEPDIATMLVRGGEQADIVFTKEAIDLVIAVAGGMPYMAQLLGLRIAQATLRRDGHIVWRDDLEHAVERLLEETPAAAKAIYAALIEVPHENMADVLLYVAAAEQNRVGGMALSGGEDHVSVGGARISRNAYSLLCASGLLGQSLGEIGAVHVQDRPVMYYVQLIAARDWLADCRARAA